MVVSPLDFLFASYIPVLELKYLACRDVSEFGWGRGKGGSASKSLLSPAKANKGEAQQGRKLSDNNCAIPVKHNRKK